MAMASDSNRPHVDAAPASALADWAQNIHPAAALVAVVLVLMPAIANQFFLFQIFSWSFILGTIALSLMFLAGYGGMVSLMQMAIAGFSGYAAAMFGVTASPAVNLGWPWWLAAPTALALATLFGSIGGALAVRTAGISTIMINLAIAAAFYLFTHPNYALFNGHTGIHSGPTPHFSGLRFRD